MSSMTVKGVVRFSVSLPPSLVTSFDNAWKGMGYDNRSKAVHDALRNFITEHEWMRKEEGTITGAIILLYYMDKPGLLNQIIKTQHNFENIVSSAMHVHLTKNKCLEIIAVKGKSSLVRSLTQELMTKKGIKQLKFAAVTT